MRIPAGSAAIVGVVALAAAVGLVALRDDGAGPAGEGGASARATTTRNPVLASGGGLANVAFYYGGTLDLPGATPEEVRGVLGNPAMVVTTRSNDEAGTVRAIHSIGAKAYRYVQLYWMPEGQQYDGLDIAQRPEWAFCRTGSTPTVGRTVGTRDWVFLDANEKAVRSYFDDLLRSLEGQGWDGVFIDRGQAATQYGTDIEGNPIWARTSTCTDDPAAPGATFADAYVSIVKLARAAGLQTMVNNGKSPFDPTPQMRPDPRDKDCRTGKWEQCRTLDDLWRTTDLVLNESAAKPKDELWQRIFDANKRSERDATYGKRTVALVTTATLGGNDKQTRPHVFYAWSRIKLFDLAVGVNTGNDECGGATDPEGICNRYGNYPELVDTRLGKVRGKSPAATGCEKKRAWRCVWTREYADGAVVLNASAKARSRVPVDVARKGCRYVLDVYSGKPLSRNRCVTQVRLDLPAWSGRPVRLSRAAW